MKDITDDSRLWDEADTLDAARAQRVEDYADAILDCCKNAEMAISVNFEHDLYDGDLLPKLMTEIANWTGRSDDAAEQMRKLHNLLAEALHEVAEGEVK
jgi:hypothetical protein